MQKVIRIRRLKKDGSADPHEYLQIVDALVEGESVIVPIDGVHGIARIPGNDLVPISETPHSEFVISDFAPLDRLAHITKKNYDFLKRIWPDEITVMLDSKDDDGRVVYARIPVSPVSHSIIEQSGGVVEFLPLINAKGKPLNKRTEIEHLLNGKIKSALIIDEWCKNHQLPTIIDIRNKSLRLIRQGRVSIEEISSLFFLGSPEDN